MSSKSNNLERLCSVCYHRYTCDVFDIDPEDFDYCLPMDDCDDFKKATDGVFYDPEEN